MKILRMKPIMTPDARKSVRPDAEHGRRDAGAPQHGQLIRTAAMLGLVTCLGLSGPARAEEAKATLALTCPVSCQVFQRGTGEQAAAGYPLPWLLGQAFLQQWPAINTKARE